MPAPRRVWHDDKFIPWNQTIDSLVERLAERYGCDPLWLYRGLPILFARCGYVESVHILSLPIR